MQQLRLKKKTDFQHPRKEKEKKKHESEVTLKWASPNKNPVHRGPKIEFSQKEIVFFTIGTSGRFFVGFWRLLGRLEKEEEQENEDEKKMEKQKRKK